LSTLGFILWLLLQAYFLVMFARVIIELLANNNPSLRNNPFIQGVARFAFVLTEPPLKLMRKVIPNIRFGSVGIDLSWAILLLLISIASSAVTNL
jgi:YggT family protein